MINFERNLYIGVGLYGITAIYSFWTGFDQYMNMVFLSTGAICIVVLASVQAIFEAIKHPEDI